MLQIIRRYNKKMMSPPAPSIIAVFNPSLVSDPKAKCGANCCCPITNAACKY